MKKVATLVVSKYRASYNDNVRNSLQRANIPYKEQGRKAGKVIRVPNEFEDEALKVILKIPVVDNWNA